MDTPRIIRAFHVVSNQFKPVSILQSLWISPISNLFRSWRPSCVGDESVSLSRLADRHSTSWSVFNLTFDYLPPFVLSIHRLLIRIASRTTDSLARAINVNASISKKTSSIGNGFKRYRPQGQLSPDRSSSISSTQHVTLSISRCKMAVRG